MDANKETTMNKIETISLGLIERANNEGRWDAPLCWWGMQRGSLIGMVMQDVEHMINAVREFRGSPEELDEHIADWAERCMRAAEDEDRASWQEYIDDVVAAAKEAATT